MKKIKKTNIAPSAFKKMLKANKSVGKFKKGIPILGASTGEIFITQFFEDVLKNSSDDVTVDDIIKVINSNKEYDFLISSIDKIKECAAEDQKKKKAANTNE